MDKPKFSKKDLERLDFLLQDFAVILNAYARKWEYSDEMINKSVKKSKEINDLFRKHWLLY